MAFSDLMGRADARIHGSRVGDSAVIGGITHNGEFWRRYREFDVGGGQYAGLDLSFDTQITASIRALEEGDELTVNGIQVRFVKRIPDAGDDSGLVTLELGTVA